MLNYFALSGAIIAGLITLRAVLIITTVSTGKKRYADPTSGFLINASAAAVFGTLAVWLIGMVTT